MFRIIKKQQDRNKRKVPFTVYNNLWIVNGMFCYYKVKCNGYALVLAWWFSQCQLGPYGNCDA